MFKKRSLELSILLWLAIILSVLAFTWFFANGIFWTELVLVLLAMISVLLLPELLVTWTILLGVVLATAVLISGIVYLTDIMVFLLLYTFPVVLWLTNKVYLNAKEREASVRDVGDEAEQKYQELLAEMTEGKSSSVQALLLHWSHNLQFLQLHPNEYNRTLILMEHTLKHSLEADEFVFYVGKGNFLVFAPNDSWNIDEYFRRVIQPQLAAIHFKNKNSLQALQFQTGSLTITVENMDRFQDYHELKSNLERQLETDIIVEY